MRYSREINTVVNLKDISKVSEQILVTHRKQGKGRSQRWIWVSDLGDWRFMIPPKTDLDVKRRADFRGKIINLTLDLSILSWISPTKSSRFGTRTWKKDASKATDLGVLEWRLRAVAVCIE